MTTTRIEKRKYSWMSLPILLTYSVGKHPQAGALHFTGKRVVLVCNDSATNSKASSVQRTLGGLLAFSHQLNPFPYVFNWNIWNGIWQAVLEGPIVLVYITPSHPWQLFSSYTFCLDLWSHCRFLSFLASIFLLSWAHLPIYFALDLRPHLHCSQTEFFSPVVFWSSVHGSSYSCPPTI